ncbi:aromatic motif membrane protein [Mycoplasmopsis felifaucium]|uniref:aromatic motif membrane protein n=1 Tax=Mycoplasmopsis felifaucium TaxID=35768 RepID=UPI0004826BC2|nr:aromatic motif membrane protein [Mycoplasmopsis felifaucium]
MKKLKFILPSLFLSAPLCVISCQNKSTTQEVNKLENLNIDSVKNDLWKSFINQDYIEALLNAVYGNKTDLKEKFIEEQKQIDETYLNDIRWAFYYGSNNIKQFGDDGGIFGTKKPKLLLQSNKIIEEFNTKNWLAFLYYFDRLNFIYYPTYDLFEESADNADISARENTQKIGTFYTPKSNKIIQYTNQLYENSEDYIENNFYLLTEDAFILQIDVSDSEPENQENIPNVQIFNYLFAFPKMVTNPELLKTFDIKQYVAYTKSFSETGPDKSKKVIYEDELGGKMLRYTVYGIK